MYVWLMNNGGWNISTYTRTQFDRPDAWHRIVVHPLYSRSYNCREAAEAARQQIETDIKNEAL